MSETGWISLAEAYARVTASEGSAARAERRLREALSAGKIATRAELAEIHEIDGSTTVRRGKPVEARCWSADSVRLQHSAISQRGLLPYRVVPAPRMGVKQEAQEPTPEIMVIEIELMISDLEGLWPAAVLPVVAERARNHRPVGTGLADADSPLLDEMHQLLIQRTAQSPTAAASMIANRIPGRGTLESRVCRIVKRYKERFPGEVGRNLSGE